MTPAWITNLKQAFEEGLASCPVVQVRFFDFPSLIVPRSVRPAKPWGHTMFEYGLNMPISIPDLKITDEGISATLCIGREPHYTFVPWEAVIGIRKITGSESVEPAKPVKASPKLKLVP